MELKTSRFYEFGPFRLEPAEHRLTRDGQQVLLTPKAYELLLYLIENHDRLVLKDQIMRAVWPGSFVEEANLTVTVSALRRALGKDNAGIQYIETVPKKGYRFAAPVTQAKTPEVIRSQSGERTQLLEDAQLEPYETTLGGRATASQLPEAETREDLRPRPVLLLSDGAHRSTWQHRVALPALAVIACALVIGGYFVYRERATGPEYTRSAQRRLAILPLRNLKQDPATDFLGFSLADAVITKLGPVSSITVRPSSAVERYIGHTINLSKVAAELNVDTLLTGSFIREGDQLRITYQLIDVKTDKILARNMIDLKYDKLLTVQDNVAQEIIKSLELNLTPSEVARIRAEAPVDPLAYEYYLRGVDLMGKHNFPLAIKMLEKSTDIDPKYPLTWAYLGQSYTSDATFELGGREQYRRAQIAYERALALQPNQLEAGIFLANLLVDTGKVENAVPLLREVLKSNPKYADAHWELGYAYRFAGMLKESLVECERARQIDPLVRANGSVLNTYLYLGQYDDFVRSLPDVNESAFFRFYRGFGEYHQGRLEEAQEDFARAYAEESTLYTGIGKAFADSIARKNLDGLEILHELQSKVQQRGVGDPEATYKIAQAYAVLGDKTSAMRMLRSTIETGFFAYPYFVRDPLLDNLRKLSEFPYIINIARERHEAFKKKFF